MDIQSTIATAKDVIVAIAALTGAGVAFAGLSTWNRQIRGQASYELARQLLRKTYLFRNMILESRRELKSLLNHKEIKRLATNEDSEISFVLPRYSEELDRIDTASSNLWAELETDFLEAEVIWEVNLQPNFWDLWRLEFEHTVHGISLKRIYNLTQESPGIDDDDKEILCDIIGKYGKSTEATFKEKLETSVLQAESQVKKHLKRI